VTKAALYYHFERKEDILLELHLRLHDLGRDMLDQLDGARLEQETVAAWPSLVNGFIDDVLANAALHHSTSVTRVLSRKLADNERHQAENEDLERRFRRSSQTPPSRSSNASAWRARSAPSSARSWARRECSATLLSARSPTTSVPQSATCFRRVPRSR
jgi:AcrR family transcriptional regulator